MKKILFIYLLLSTAHSFAQSGYKEYRVKVYDDGSRYEGYFINDERNGQGTFYWTTGEKYIGEWMNGNRTGYGDYYWPSGDIYEGYFVNGLKNGQGTFYWANGNTYVGNYLENKRNGYGVLSIPVTGDRHINNCSNCRTYKGNWLNDDKSGFGKCYDVNEVLLYEGQFANDKPVSEYPNR